MRYLIVVAHPDDEVLGAGATIKKLTLAGEKVSVCIMCGKVAARVNRPEDEALLNDMNQCLKVLGVEKLIIGDFPNVKMNTTPHLELVQFIENAIKETEANVIITHHPSDLNNDHVQTSVACQAAARLFQRDPDVVQLNELLFMEVPSSTEWALNASQAAFRPNTFIEVGKESLDAKIKALSCYRGVMRPYPHPRSEEAILGLAAYRGAMSGCNYAEAFECAMRRNI